MQQQGKCTDCSGYGICNGTTGLCVCNGDYTGKTNYYEYKNDCQNNLNVRNAMAKVTIAIASVILFLSIIVLCLKLKKKCCTEEYNNNNVQQVNLISRIRKSATNIRSSTTGRTKSISNRALKSIKLQRQIIFICLRVIIASIISIIYEAANIENGPLEMFGTNGSHEMLIPRAMFPWLVVGGAIYVVDFVTHLLPIAFIRGSRESQRNILSRVKVSSITWFSRHNMKLDFVIFLQFLWLAILPQFDSGREICESGHFCMTILEISIGLFCIPSLFVLNNAIYLLVNMLLEKFIPKKKVRSRRTSIIGDASIKCQDLMQFILIVGGCKLFTIMYGKKVREHVMSQGKSWRLAMWRLQLIHGASFVAAWGALVFCTFNGTIEFFYKRPSIFVTFTMWFAHFFNGLVVLSFALQEVPIPENCCRNTICKRKQDDSNHPNIITTSDSEVATSSDGQNANNDISMEVKKCEEKDLESGTKINGKEDNEISKKVYDKDEARKIAIIRKQIEKHEKTIQTIKMTIDKIENNIKRNATELSYHLV